VAFCYFHGDRTGVGVCMRCRVVICAECCTRVDGINHCHACLKAIASRREPARPRVGPRGLTAGVVLGVGWLALFFVLLAWYGLLGWVDGVLSRLSGGG
jgi:hypothetical protein